MQVMGMMYRIKIYVAYLKQKMSTKMNDGKQYFTQFAIRIKL